VSLLAGLAPDRYAQLAGRARPVTIRAGEVLFRHGDRGDELYVVRSGRIEIVLDDQVIRVHGRGESFGEVAMLTGGRRSATVRARRDSELLALHRTDVDRLIATEPAFSAALVRQLAIRLPGTEPARTPGRTTGPVLALVAAAPGPEIAWLAGELVTALGGPAAVACVEPGPDPAQWPARLDAAEAAAAGRPVLLVADRPHTAWARYCLRQADRPLLVIDPDRDPPLRAELPAAVRLVALQADSRGLCQWLDSIEPVAHHLVEPGSRADVARMARRVTARSLGVVLSGGGARGLAHIGVLDELVRAGACIDRVGGTSMGAVVAGLFATGATPAELLELARAELVPRRLFGDLVWPRHALIRGRRAEVTLARMFGGALIEDQHRRMFAVSVDLVAAERVVHRRGPIADAVALSARIPGIVPPRRVGDRLHVDGGVLDNLPVREMAAEGEGPVVAVDVAQPFGTGPGPLPPIVDTIGRSMMIASSRRDDPGRMLAHTVLTPRLDGFGLFDFGRLDELVDRGREAARDALERLRPLLPG
jgi:NTE family protein